MRIILLSVTFFLFVNFQINSQTVSGQIIDDMGTALPNIELQLFIGSANYQTTTNSNGNFVFNVVTNVDDETLPIGYSVSNNFPNPFNPVTRINISLPERNTVTAEVFNILGQSVVGEINRQFESGINHIDLELDGLSNGMYFARIRIGNKYAVTRKMMLVYGSQHLVTYGNFSYSQIGKWFNENNLLLDTFLDSLVATSSIIGRKTFLNLPAITGGTLNLGDLEIERHCPGIPTVNYSGKTYNTVQIGSQCWLRENLDVGTRINSGQNQSNNGTIEKYCYNNNPGNCETYGGLYQWNEVMAYSSTPAAQGICPAGWHIPTLNELQTLSSIVDGNSNVLKLSGQGSGAGAGTNTAGFSAFLTGYMNYDGNFTSFEEVTHFWSSTEVDGSSSNSLHLGFNNNGMFLINYNKDDGFCVRCVKD